MRRADVVSVYASLNAETRGMIGAREIALTQPHAYLVNIARGELIDEAVLTRALEEDRIAGAALDVFEPMTQSSLFVLDNVVVTPHMAGLTNLAKSDAALKAVRNALAVLDGRTSPNLMNRPRGLKAAIWRCRSI